MPRKRHLLWTALWKYFEPISLSIHITVKMTGQLPITYLIHPNSSEQPKGYDTSLLQEGDQPSFPVLIPSTFHSHPAPVNVGKHCRDPKGSYQPRMDPVSKQSREGRD